MIDKDRFFAAQSGLDARIRIASGQPFVSLREGLPRDWEGYKQVVRAIARDRLGPEKWSRSAIGDGRILEATIHAIEIEESRDIRNNMVSFQARWGEESRPHHRLCAARGDRVATERIERALFTLYRASPADESSAFEALESSVGRRFPLLSYLFFLKDETTFLPVRQRFFGQAFAMIGLEPAPNLTCSWQNYLDFLAAVEEVREALGAWLNLEHPTLLEAHSWLWMIQTSDKNFLRTREERERRARRAIARPGARSEARQSSGAR